MPDPTPCTTTILLLPPAAPDKPKPRPGAEPFTYAGEITQACRERAALERQRALALAIARRFLNRHPGA